MGIFLNFLINYYESMIQLLNRGVILMFRILKFGLTRKHTRKELTFEVNIKFLYKDETLELKK